MKITTPSNREIACETLTFSGGERHIQLAEPFESSPEFLNVRFHVRNSQDLIDLFLVINALRHQYSESTPINLELPYLPYARQDRVCSPGQAFSLSVIASWLKDLNLNQLVVWDCHSKVGTDLTRAHNVKPADIIRSHKRLVSLLQNDKSILICPDKGATNRCQHIVESLQLNDMVFCEKQRDPRTGAIHKTEVLADDLTGKTAIITDDICDGGYTFIKIAERLRELNASKVVLFVTHGIFSKGLEVFDNLIDEIFTTQSFTHESNEKLTIINFEHNFT